ncbi:MAG: hypothetical protein A3G87_07375 [Omnitrophica bacterium RIFCSPLOWO2_12_FULL_50_11]|nr:MAG: hypothetical protein A3G87_07375 [Omnitrophica bacterium RIFCSPLOWO2_12_FULL_50_11]
MIVEKNTLEPVVLEGMHDANGIRAYFNLISPIFKQAPYFVQERHIVVDNQNLLPSNISFHSSPECRTAGSIPHDQRYSGFWNKKREKRRRLAMTPMRRFKLMWATVVRVRDGDYDCYHFLIGNLIGRILRWLN